jgi:hypothetical protein
MACYRIASSLFFLPLPYKVLLVTNILKRNAYGLLVGIPEGKRPLGRPSHRWVDNNKMDFRAIVWDGMDWIDLAQDRDQ